MKKPTADDVTNKIVQIVGTMTGRTVTLVQTFDDPTVNGTWAIRCTFDDGTHQDFLVISTPITQLTEDDLEEVDFDTWPPRSRY